MGIFSKYLRAHKVEELPSTNPDREALYIMPDGKSENFMIAVRNKTNDQWHTLKGLVLGTTADTAAPGNHTHSQYLTIDDIIENHLGKEFIGTYLNPITTPTVTFTVTNKGNEAIITYQGATMPTIVHEEGSDVWKLNFLDMGIDFVPNELCRIYLHIVDSLTTADELFIDITVKPITLL